MTPGATARCLNESLANHSLVHQLPYFLTTRGERFARLGPSNSTAREIFDGDRVASDHDAWRSLNSSNDTGRRDAKLPCRSRVDVALMSRRKRSSATAARARLISEYLQKRHATEAEASFAPSVWMMSFAVPTLISPTPSTDRT